MRNRVLNLPRRFVTAEPDLPQKRDADTGAAYASRLDRLLATATDAPVENEASNAQPAASVGTKTERQRKRRRSGRK